MITVYTAKDDQYHGLLINFGLGSSIRVTLYNKGKREDTFYIDTQTGRKTTCVDGGNGKLLGLRNQKLSHFDVPHSISYNGLCSGPQPDSYNVYPT